MSEETQEQLNVDVDDGDNVYLRCEENCVICFKPFGNIDAVTIGDKGLTALLKYSESRGDHELHRYLSDRSKITPIGKILVHATCRKKYTDARKSIMDMRHMEGPCQKRLRSSTPELFSWREHCLFCVSEAILDIKHPERDHVVAVQTIPIRSTILQQCHKRADTWATKVQTRVEGCIDFVAAEARYHRHCYLEFMHVLPRSTHLGRPTDDNMDKTFDALCSWLDNDCELELYTLEELRERMSTLAGSDEVYSMKRLKQKLQDHYGNHVFFAEVSGIKNVVSFRNMANFIITEKWYSERDINSAQEADRIVLAAAKIIREEIRESKYTRGEYPSIEDIKDPQKGKHYLTPCLRTFVERLIPSNIVRQASIGQALLQSVKPRTVLAPILFGLGVEVDHVFGSKWLVDELFQLGFSISYDEVSLFKQSVMQEESLKTLVPPLESTFTQWAADNVDHNIRTLTGENTFHGMGVIAMFTKRPSLSTDPCIKRRAKVTADELVSGKGIPITPYIGPSAPALSSVIFEPIQTLQFPHTELPSVFYSNVLWQSAGFLSKSKCPAPNWSGFMQHVFSANDEQTVMKSEVLLLPIIDLNPNDATSIYSTLLYIGDQASRLSIPTACVTFDQPLWAKAMEIVTSKNLNSIVVRLGGFHLLMSACGSVFHMMKGSGIEEALEEVYGPNAVTHMMSGKAIARALRGLYLIEMALTTKLLSTILPQESSVDDTDDTVETLMEPNIIEGSHMLNKQQTKNLEQLLSDVLDLRIAPDAIADSPDIVALNDAIKCTKAFLSNQSRTAKLWIHCLEYITVIKDFISSERLGNWEGHLLAVGKLLNLFAATGHINYAKSARLYLQMMRKLPNAHPWLYKKFSEDGYHTVRRSERRWAGLWTDLVIEQVMMRSLKSRGGLTRGRGMTESVRQQWIYSMHACATVHNSMSSLTGMQHTTSFQHEDFATSRREHDWRDMKKIMDWFLIHDPFDSGVVKLRSLASGLTASENDGINCDETEKVGTEIQRSMDNQPVSNATIKRKQMVCTLNDLKPGIKLDKQVVRIDPSILFLRCTALAQREDEDIAPYFAYEMTAIPTSLFKDHMMRKVDKSELARTIQTDLTNLVSSTDTQQKQQNLLVIDGGWLLHFIRWRKNATYSEVLEQCSSFIKNKYGMCCVVFDGYAKPSPKDHEHQRRQSGKISADIIITDTTKVYKDQEAFLSNEMNKTQFIKFLANHLQIQGHNAKISNGDADTLIVSTALELARNGQSVVVVAEDTDIFIMLLYHWESDMADIHLRKEGRRSKIGQIYSMKEAFGKVPEIVRKHSLFIHAWSGCDTTSATYGHGKSHLMKQLTKSTDVQNLSTMISMRESTTTEVGNAGIRLFLILYSGSTKDTLATLRYARYMAMMARSNTVEPKRLPPTERAAYYHSLRVHLQVVSWNNLNNDSLEYCEWGWKDDNECLCPVMTDRDAAPSKVLKFIRCKCKQKGKNPCGTNQCSCHKNGLKCMMACMDCRGEFCNNAETAVVLDEETDA